MDQSSGHIQNAWHKTTEGRQYYSAIVRQGKRKVYGLLERPIFSLQHSVETVPYKLFVSGKAGVGKTSTVAKLTGRTVPVSHMETPGIITSVAYWPAKLAETNQVVLFKLHFWDAGENAIKKFDHILPLLFAPHWTLVRVISPEQLSGVLTCLVIGGNLTMVGCQHHPTDGSKMLFVDNLASDDDDGYEACQDSVSAILFLFSFTDRPSFEDLRNQMTRLSSQSGSTFIKVVIGTKYDQYSHSEITTRELQDFQEQWQVPILKVKNISKPQENDLLYSVDNFAEINDVAPLLNGLVESLWSQGKLSSGGSTRDAGVGPIGRPPGHRTPAPVDNDELDATYV